VRRQTPTALKSGAGGPCPQPPATHSAGGRQIEGMGFAWLRDLKTASPSSALCSRSTTSPALVRPAATRRLAPARASQHVGPRLCYTFEIDKVLRALPLGKTGARWVSFSTARGSDLS
jgi:hypothetical protein